MYIGITTTTHSTRSEYYHNLLKQCSELGYKVISSIDDGSLGIYNNKKQCWVETLDKSITENTSCILAEDDIELSKNFQEYINTLDDEFLFYSLFNRLRNRKDVVKKGELEIYVKPKNGLYEQAIYIPASRVREFREMYRAFRNNLSRLQEQDPRQKQHPDQMLQAFLFENNIYRGNVKQSLVQHVGRKSSLGHFIGEATIYIDNIK